MVHSDMTVTSFVFQCLPHELLAAICKLLPNRDIKSLRLTCRYLADKSPLRFDRVFISANPLNIEVLIAVANHEVFRHRVREIIWDDAILDPVSDEKGNEPCGYSSDEADFEEKGRISKHFLRLCKDSIFKTRPHLKDKNKHHGEKHPQDQMSNVMPLRESLAYYNRLLQQQREILESGDDEEAFRYAVQRFPRLTKVTVTPATHGFLFTPLYETPMIRAFPCGFVYPIPRGWPCAENQSMAEDADSWEDEDEKNKWRGFRIVTRVLARQAENCQISEFLLDSNKLPTGLNHFVFDEPNEEYDNLCKIVEQPGFRRLVLSLLVGYLYDYDAQDWDFYRNGRISNLLAKASDLQEVVLQTDYPVDATSWGGEMKDFVSLFDIFPIEKWSSGGLKHFGLSGMQVTQNDLIYFLSKLPSTLESIELSFLSVIDGQGSHAGILADIRDKLDWRHRPLDKRVKVRMLVRLNQPDHGRYICLDKEVHEYIYGEGLPPFDADGEGGSYGMMTQGMGIKYDEFDTTFVMPLR
ncbi:hypothetical protein IL306_006631 [Fusarium sp. DS 682]|nr:hypothetical protein IL306_006631 [Fusarium sp. DS 682]